MQAGQKMLGIQNSSWFSTVRVLGMGADAGWMHASITLPAIPAASAIAPLKIASLKHKVLHVQRVVGPQGCVKSQQLLSGHAAC